MAITINQTAFGKTLGVNPVTATFASPIAFGDTLVAFIGMDDFGVQRAVSSVTDSIGNTWTQVPHAYGATNGTGGEANNTNALDIWVATNVLPAASLTVTATMLGVDGSSFFDLAVYDLSACVVQTAAKTTTTSLSSTFSGPSLSSGVAALFLVGFDATGTNVDSIQAPWTISAGISANLAVGYVSESSGAQQPVWSINSSQGTPAVCSVVVLINAPPATSVGFPPSEYGFGFGHGAPQSAPKFYSGGWSFGRMQKGPVFNK